MGRISAGFDDFRPIFGGSRRILTIWHAACFSPMMSARLLDNQQPTGRQPCFSLGRPGGTQKRWERVRGGYTASAT